MTEVERIPVDKDLIALVNGCARLLEAAKETRAEFGAARLIEWISSPSYLVTPPREIDHVD